MASVRITAPIFSPSASSTTSCSATRRRSKGTRSRRPCTRFCRRCRSRICQVDATVPRALAAIVERALAKPLDERYQSMTALRGRSAALSRPDPQERQRRAFHLADPTGLDARCDHDALTRVGTRPVGRARIRRRGGSRTVRWHAIGRGSVGRRRAGRHRTSGSGVTRVTFATRWPWIIVAGVVLASGAIAIPWFLMRHQPPEAAPQKIEQPRRRSTCQRPSRPRSGRSTRMTTPRPSGRRRPYCSRRPVIATRDESWTGARSEAAAVENGLREARASLASGDFQAASRAAGDVLTVDGGNREAKQIMEQGAMRAGARSAADARTRMTGAREQARAANAPTLAASAYRTAVRAEQSAQRLLQAGRNAEATARFYEASGLYQSAASLAQVQADEKPRAERRSRSAAASGSRHIVGRQARLNRPRHRPSAPPALLYPRVRRSRNHSRHCRWSRRHRLRRPPPAAPAEESSSRGTGGRRSNRPVARALQGRARGPGSRSAQAGWPGLSESSANAIRNDFQNATRITVDIFEPRIVASGATGTVTFRRRYELQTRDGQRLADRNSDVHGGPPDVRRLGHRLRTIQSVALSSWRKKGY